jgi:hypothetical protein
LSDGFTSGVGLGGVGLSCSQLGHSFDQGDEVGDQGKYLRRCIAARAATHGEQAGSGPEGVASASSLRRAAVGSAGSSVVAGRDAVEQGVVQGLRGDVECVGCGPGSIRAFVQGTRGAVAQVFRCFGGAAGRVLVDPGTFLMGEPG